MSHEPGTAEASDADLLTRLASDDGTAFDGLFLRHRRAVFGFVSRMVDGDSTTAEDLTQECFLRLWRGRHSLSPGNAAVRTLILTIARNVTLDYRKRRTVGTQSLSETLPITSETKAGWPEPAILQQELQGVLDAAMALLPTELSEVLHLREEQSLSYEAIAVIIGCPIGTMKSRLHKARKFLREAGQAYMNEPLPTRHILIRTERRGEHLQVVRREETLQLVQAPRLESSSGYIYTIREEKT